MSKVQPLQFEDKVLKIRSLDSSFELNKNMARAQRVHHPQAVMLFTCFLSLAILFTFVQCDNQTFNVYFVSDIQYQLFSENENGTICKDNQTDCYGGLARLVQLKADIAKNSTNSLWINAGNFIGKDKQSLFDILKFSPAEAANATMLFDAIAIGPEDLHYGKDAAQGYFDAWQGKVVAANIDSFLPSITIQVNTTSSLTNGTSDMANVTIIGFFGRNSTVDSFNMAIEDEVESVTKEVKSIKAKKPANFTIAIGSGSYDLSNNISNIDGIDVVVISGASSTIPKDQQGKNETCYSNKKGKNMTICILDFSNKHVGQITVSSENQTFQVQAASVKVLTSDTTEDNSTKHLVDEWNDAITKEKESNRKSHFKMDKEQCTKEECLLGNLITDSVILAAQGFSGSQGWNYFTKMAILPSGVIHGGLNPNPKDNNIPIDQIFNMLTEDYYVYNVSINGTQLKKLLEESVSNDFMQVFGMKVEYEPKNSNLTILNLNVTCQACPTPTLERVGDKNIYFVAVPSSLAHGKLKTLNSTFLGFTITEAVRRQYEKSSSWMMPHFEGRISIVTPEPKEICSCPNDTAEVVIITLVVVFVLSIAAFLFVRYAMPRIRQRRDSTTALLS